MEDSANDERASSHATWLGLAFWVAVLTACVFVQLPSTQLAHNRAVQPQMPASRATSESGSAAIARDGSTVFLANSDLGSVSSIDTRSDEKIAEIFVGEEPRSLALSPDDERLYVANQGSSTLSVLDAKQLAILTTISVGAEPYGVVAEPGGRLVYVASSGTASIEVVKLRSDISRSRVIARIPVGPRPKGLALSADGSRLYVTHFLSGEVSVIDTSSREVVQIIPTGIDSNMAQKIAIHPTNGRAYLPHVRSNTSNRFLLFDTAVFPLVSVLDLGSNRSLPSERMDLSLGVSAVNLPFDLTFSTDGERMYVVGLGSGDLSVMDLATRQRIARIDVGDGPRGIVVTPDGRKAYVLNSLSEDVSVVDLVLLEEIKRIRVASSPLDPQIKRGKLLFFSSRSTETSKDRWMSCATCHFDGEHDGRTWFTERGPRNTTSLRGTGDTRPLHWSADRDEMQDFEHTIRQLQAGSGLMRDREVNPTLGAPNGGLSADLDALAAFVESLRPKPSPFTDGEAAIERGRKVFEREDVGCARCHAPPRFTDSTITASPFIKHDVGTGDGPDELFGPAFDTPSLRGLWDSAPYLHDGSAATLRDVLVTRNAQDRHGRTSHLSKKEIRNLIRFLLSL